MRNDNKTVLNSSVLAQVTWTRNGSIDALGNSLGTLRAWFTSGKVYDYLDVPYGLFRLLLVWPSAGRFYNVHIRGKYRSVKRHGYRVRKALITRKYEESLLEQLSRSAGL